MAPPSPVVLASDPSLLFVNAGMNQFKDILLGTGTRSYTRAVNSQPCIRVSGKHNDLDTVGHDGYHLTAFEMLGSWSFGDYTKSDAITWAWLWLTEHMNLPKTKLYATVYETDSESVAYWQNNTDINHDHIILSGKADNFWEMGETGPCGPCSELHIDRGPEACDQPPGHVCGVNSGCARYIELWNLVFIQYNRVSSSELRDLPLACIDTGAGLERLTAYKQGVLSVYETDLFTSIIAASHAQFPAAQPSAHRVIADHMRTLCLGIADGVLPSNTGRGYVLRRLLRRAMRFAREATQSVTSTPDFSPVIQAVIQTWGQRYPQLETASALIQACVTQEVSSFMRTLDAGLAVLTTWLSAASEQSDPVLTGDKAFQLYDTYGFPFDLTLSMASEHGITVDQAGFEQARQDQQTRSRANQAQRATDSEFGDQRIQTDTVIYCTHPEGARGGEDSLPETPADRLNMARHHTATHLIHAALHQVLGAHITQAGSRVSSNRLRFDFTHHSPVSVDEKEAIQAQVTQYIHADLPVQADYMSLKHAQSQGATALFGHTYPDTVRVIQIGDVSQELCGGHHVTHTALLESCRIISLSAVGAGVRRLEAIIGHDADRDYTAIQRDHRLQKLTSLWQQYYTDPVPPSWQTDTLPALDQAYTRLKLDCEARAQAATQTQQQQAKLCAAAATPLDCHGYPVIMQLIATPQLSVFADYSTALHATSLVIALTDTNPRRLLIKQGSSWSGQLTPETVLKQALKIAQSGKGGGRGNRVQAGGLSLDDTAAFFSKLHQYLCDALV